MNIEINIVFDRKEFEEIYFKGDNVSYFLSSFTKKTFFVLLVISFLIFLGAYSQKYSVSGEYLFLSFCLLFSSIVLYLSKVMELIKWKKSVIQNLDYQEKYSSHKLIISEEYFILKQDNDEFIEDWSKLQGAILNEKYIGLIWKGSYFLPKKSIGTETFDNLTIFVSEKLNKE